MSKTKKTKKTKNAQETLRALTNAPMTFTWAWCRTCDRAAVICPKCGNNCCNGGSGQVDGELCDICNLAYQYQDLAVKGGREPLEKDCTKIIGDMEAALAALEKVEF